MTTSRILQEVAQLRSVARSECSDHKPQALEALRVTHQLATFGIKLVTLLTHHDS